MNSHDDESPCHSFVKIKLCRMDGEPYGSRTTTTAPLTTSHSILSSTWRSTQRCSWMLSVTSGRHRRTNNSLDFVFFFIELVNFLSSINQHFDDGRYRKFVSVYDFVDCNNYEMRRGNDDILQLWKYTKSLHGHFDKRIKFKALACIGGFGWLVSANR